MNKDDIVEILGIIGATHIKRFRKDVQCACILAPWRIGHSEGSDHAGSMGISVNEDGPSVVNCFSCHYRGTLAHALKYFTMKSRGDFGDLLKRVGDIERIDPEHLVGSIGDYGAVPKGEEAKQVFPVGECVFRIFEIIPGAHQYLIDRGLILDTLKAWDTRYDEYRKRVLFPIRKLKGDPSLGCQSDSRVVGASGRTVLLGHKPVYYNYFTFPKSLVLFGEHFYTGQRRAIIVEGILDTVAVWQALHKAGRLDDTVVLGVMGSMMSNAQAAWIKKTFEEVVLFFDNDPAGWTGQRMAARALQRALLLKVVDYSKMELEDPAALVCEGADVVQLLDEALLIHVGRGG